MKSKKEDETQYLLAEIVQELHRIGDTLEMLHQQKIDEKIDNKRKGV